MLFEAEYSNLKDSLTEPTSSRQQSKDEEMEALRRRAERAESLLEKSYREAGVWNSTRQAVEERLAELRLTPLRHACSDLPQLRPRGYLFVIGRSGI
jgi:chromosome segregation ATPase